MKVEKIKVGALPTNCYIVFDEAQKEGFVVDPGYPDKKITDFIDKNKLKIKFIYLTHCHFDHILGADWLKDKMKVPVICLDKEFENVKDENVNLSLNMLGEKVSFECDKTVFENDELSVGNSNFRVIHTPGHTSGSSCLYGEEILIAGDTIFCDCFGRCDLPTGNLKQIVNSIKNKLQNLPKETIIYSGHGDITTMEKRFANEWDI